MTKVKGQKNSVPKLKNRKMSANDSDISALISELRFLKDSESDAEYSFYVEKIIDQYDIIEGLVKGLPGFLKSTYAYPFNLSPKDSEYIVANNGFQCGDIVLKIVKDGDKRTLQAKEINLEQLKAYATDINKLCASFKKHIKKETLQAQKEIAKQAAEF